MRRGVSGPAAPHVQWSGSNGPPNSAVIPKALATAVNYYLGVLVGLFGLWGCLRLVAAEFLPTLCILVSALSSSCGWFPARESIANNNLIQMQDF